MAKDGKVLTCNVAFDGLTLFADFVAEKFAVVDGGSSPTSASTIGCTVSIQAGAIACPLS